jgi:hypothetical protein
MPTPALCLCKDHEHNMFFFSVSHSLKCLLASPDIVSSNFFALENQFDLRNSWTFYFSIPENAGIMHFVVCGLIAYVCNAKMNYKSLHYAKIYYFLISV